MVPFRRRGQGRQKVPDDITATLTILLMVILEIGLASVHAAKTVNVMLFYEKQESVKSFDAAIDYIKSNPSLDITIGEVYKVMSNGTNATKLIQTLCKDIDEAYGQAAGKQPDIIIDFTIRDIPSETVKLITKVMTLPTISAAFSQHGDITSWSELSEKQKNYLIEITPPADMVLRAIRSLVSQQEMTSAGILFSDDYEMSRNTSLLNGMPTRQFYNRLWRGRDMAIYEIDKFVDLDITNFFIAASPSKISNVLGNASRPWSKDHSYFSKEYAWYSMSMEPGFPHCKGCRDNVSLVHLEPKLSDAGVARRTFLMEKLKQINLMDLFYFDLTMNAISTVAKMKKAGTWAAPPKRVCREAETSPDDYELKLFDNLAQPEISKENALGSFYFDPEKRTGKSFAKFQMTIRRLQYNPRDEEPTENVHLGLWNSGFTEKDLITHEKDVESQWEDHLAEGVIRIATVVQKPFVFKSSKCGMTKEYKRFSPARCEITGPCIDLLSEITQAYNLTYTTWSIFPSHFFPRQWRQLAMELMDRQAFVNLGEVAFKLNQTGMPDYDDESRYELMGISIPVPKGTKKTSLMMYLKHYATDGLISDMSKCVLNRLRYFSFKSTI